MDITSFVLGMKLGGGDKEASDFNLKLASAVLTRNASYLGDSTTLNIPSFILPDGNRFGTVSSHVYAGFDQVRRIKIDRTVIIADFAFAGDKQLELIDLSAFTTLGVLNFQAHSLEGIAWLSDSTGGGWNFPLKTIICRPDKGYSLKYVYFQAGSLPDVPQGFEKPYVYVPAADYDTVASNWMTDGDIPLSHLRILEDYPEIDRWNEKYTVRFFDGDTLLRTVTVKCGENASYTPTKEGATFIGWDKDVTKVVSDMDVYAKWKLIFATASWSDISQACEAGEAQEHFALGDTRPFTFTHNGTTYSMDLKIVGFNTEDKSDGSGKAGITISMNKQTIYAPINSKNQTVWTWASCDLRALLNGEVLNTFDPELRNVIKTVKKDRIYYNGSANATEYTDDKLWLPSLSEIGKSDSNSLACGNSYQNSVVAFGTVTNMSGAKNYNSPFRNGHKSSGAIVVTYIPAGSRTYYDQINTNNNYIMPFFCI